jgi:hypothetical protein
MVGAEPEGGAVVFVEGDAQPQPPDFVDGCTAALHYAGYFVIPEKVV